MSDIKAIVARFNAATEARASADTKLRDLDIDIAVAERNGDPIEPIQKARNLVLMTEWSVAHKGQQEALSDLFAALGVDAKTLRSVLASRTY